MSRASDAARDMAAARWKGTTAAERKAQMSAAARKLWAGMSEAERAAFVKSRKAGRPSKKKRAKAR